MKKKKFLKISIFLAALIFIFLAALFYSCKYGNNDKSAYENAAGPENSGGGALPETQSREQTEATDAAENLPERDFGGYNFRIRQIRV